MGLLDKLFGRTKPDASGQLIDRCLVLSIALAEALDEFAKVYPNNSAISQARVELGNSAKRTGEARGERLPVVINVQQAAKAVDNIQRIVGDISKNNPDERASSAIETINRDSNELADILARMMAVKMGLKV